MEEADASENAKTTLNHGIYSVAAFSIIVYLFCYYIKYLRIKPKVPLDVQKVLIITSHPDDECMFFSPTIQSLTGTGNFVHVLCLSTGDYYGEGWRRKQEIIRSCSVLGIPESNVHVYNDSALPDNPNVNWSLSEVEQVVLPVIYYLQPHAVISFDNYGVSGHSNHVSINRALENLCHRNELPHFVRVFKLESTPILRKYISVLDLPISMVTSQHMAVVSPWGFLKGLRAMMCHRSQLEWFRFLYVLFSRYMLINTLEEIHHVGQ